MGSRRGGRFKLVVMQEGPVPPSGGPQRERYLDHQGRCSLEVASSEYVKACAVLGARADSMPTVDFELIASDDRLRRAVERDKRSRWNAFRADVEQHTLDAIEPHIKTSVRAAMDALNYLEDHELREEAHTAIHAAAFVKRGLFGCPIVMRDDEYWTDCPINISHLRVGVSAGLVADFECSVCGDLVEDCDHQMGEPYPKLAEHTADGTCTICDALECEHAEGEFFLVQAGAVARNASASEVSLVSRPRYPLARFVEQSRDLGPLHEDFRIRRAAEQGLLNCDADLGPCSGFNEMRVWGLDLDPEYKGR